VTDELTQKVQGLLRAVAGDLADRVSATTLHRVVIRRIKQAHVIDLGADDASRLGMHMSDWAGDGAFLLALHLFPDQFTDEEVRDGVARFLAHAPNHIRAACGITGSYVWEDFPDDDISSWDDAP
jgi:hypothetical protein